MNITAKYLIKKANENEVQHSNFNKSPTDMHLAIGTTYLMKASSNFENFNWRDTLYLFIKSTYTNYESKTKQVIREIHVYDYAKKTWGIPSNDTRIIEALKHNNLY